MQNRPNAPLTTYEVSRFLHVDLTTVINWCDQGKLKAYKTPGGHRRVQRENFLEFLRKFHIPVPKEFTDKVKGLRKVLVAVESSEVRAAVVGALKRKIAHLEIVEARSAFEAGKAAADQPPALVILDLGPEGTHAAHSLKEDDRFSKTKILALLDPDWPEPRRKLFENESDAQLQKPLDPNRLIEKAAELLRIPA